MSAQQPGWLPDPTGRHEQRYWDGQAWTEHVSDRGVASTDPLAPPPPVTPPQPMTGSGEVWSAGPPGTRPAPWTTGPPQRGGSRAALLVVLGVVLVAAVGGAAFVLLQDDDEDGGDSGERQEYVDAIATAILEDEEQLPYSEAEARCLAEAEVDIIGLEKISAEVTPEEIRENPEDGLSDYGIDPDPDQGSEMLDALKGCVDDFGGLLAESFASDVPGIDVDEVGGCLADGLDTPEVEDMLAGAIARGEDADMTEDEAVVLYEWLDGCIDFHTAMVDAMAAEMEDPEAGADCLAANLSEDVLRDLIIANFTGDEDAEAEFDDTVGPIVAECMAEGG